MNFLLSYAILAEIYAILSISTNLMVGIIGHGSKLLSAGVTSCFYAKSSCQSIASRSQIPKSQRRAFKGFAFW